MEMPEEHVDPISLSEIPEEHLITFEQMGVIFNFDIESLAEYVRMHGNHDNPLNRQSLPEIAREKIDKYIDATNITISIGRFLGEKHEYKMAPSTDIGTIIATLWRSDKNMMRRNIYVDGGSLFEKDLIHTKLGDMANGGFLRLIVPDPLSYETGDVGIRLNRMYKWSIARDRDDIAHMIDPVYRQDPPSIIPIDAGIEQRLTEFLNGNPDMDLNDLRDGITDILAYGAIGANVATALCEPIEKRYHYNGDVPSDRSILLKAIHKIYTHVADTFNLKPAHGIGGYYFTSRYHVPTVYTIGIMLDKRLHY